MPTPVLDIRNLSFTYRARETSGFAWDDVEDKRELPATAIAEHTLRDLSFRLEPGQIGLVTGPSGCGKTTLLHLINGIIPEFYDGDRAGEILVAGRPVLDIPTDERGAFVGSIFQNPRSQFFNVHVREEAYFGCENLALEPEQILRRVHALRDRLGVTAYWEKRLFTLSGGQKQRVACLCVAAMEPALLLYDEPSSNLDAEGMRDLAELMSAFRSRGVAQLISEHRLAYLADLVDHVWVMEDGQFRATYTGDEFRELSPARLAELSLRQTREPSCSDLQRRRLWFCGSAGSEISTGSGTPTGSEAPAGRETRDSALLDVSLRLQYRGETRPTLDCRHLRFEAGRIHALTGRNGLGKTSFLRALAGLESRARGRIVFGGRSYSPRRFRGLCAMVFQDVNHQLLTHSVEEELRLAAELSHRDRGAAAASPDLDELLEELGLADFRHRHPLALSGGQKQRLALAAALLSERTVLLLDEPTSGLDFRHMYACARMLNKAVSSRLVLVATHDREFLEALDAVVWEG